MTVIGYARVSTTDQDLSIQKSALRAAGCDVIRAEKRSGTTTQGRDELRTVLDFLRKGDVLMVNPYGQKTETAREPVAHEPVAYSASKVYRSARFWTTWRTHTAGGKQSLCRHTPEVGVNRRPTWPTQVEHQVIEVEVELLISGVFDPVGSKIHLGLLPPFTPPLDGNMTPSEATLGADNPSFLRFQFFDPTGNRYVQPTATAPHLDSTNRVAAGRGHPPQRVRYSPKADVDSRHRPPTQWGH
jgi:hypothetical protein